MSDQVNNQNGVVQTQPLADHQPFSEVYRGQLSSSTVGRYWEWAFSDIVGNA